ncbi:MAG: TIM barrel protein [Spirosomataceae bacterium]
MVIERLKQLAPKAEKERIILAIESYLSAKEHLEIIDAVGSPNVQVYYDPRNAADAGHDPYTEIPLLGKRKLICEVHLKENDFLLGQGSIDWPRIKQLLQEIKYKGWVHLEGLFPKENSG